MVHAVIPFHVDFAPGSPLYEQVVYAATKAIISGQLRPGDDFPSVRALSRELKINPNTAHKVITSLVDAGLLEITPGSAPVVAKRATSSKAERTNLLQHEVEQLVVEARRLGIDVEDVQGAIAKHWARLSSKRKWMSDSKGGR
jgi:DNA-binding transcriptional regulator YhcF (GntR family)